MDSFDVWLGAGLSCFLMLYLAFALLNPERFD